MKWILNDMVVSMVLIVQQETLVSFANLLHSPRRCDICFPIDCTTNTSNCHYSFHLMAFYNWSIPLLTPMDLHCSPFKIHVCHWQKMLSQTAFPIIFCWQLFRSCVIYLSRSSAPDEVKNGHWSIFGFMYYEMSWLSMHMKCVFSIC